MNVVVVGDLMQWVKKRAKRLSSFFFILQLLHPDDKWICKYQKHYFT